MAEKVVTNCDLTDVANCASPNLKKVMTPTKQGMNKTSRSSQGNSPNEKSNTGSASPAFKDKAYLKPITEKFTPRGCFETLKRCEEWAISEAIEEETRERIRDKTDNVVKHAYIDALLRGLGTATDIAMLPLTEILKDCMLDSDKDKYIERIVNY